MSGELFRPTFELRTETEAGEVAARLKAAFDDAGDSFETRWARGERHALVTLSRGRRRWWSAWMHLDVRQAHAGDEKDDEASESPGTIVFARFTPAPGLWTGTMLALIALLAIVLFGMALGLAQMTLESTPWGWWVVLGAVGTGVALVLGSLAAQRRAGPEMTELKQVVEGAVGGGAGRPA